MKTRWPLSRIGDTASFVARGESPTAGTTYRQIGVRWWGEGAYERETIDGSQTKYSQFFRAEAGDLIFNKIWARHGAVAMVDSTLAGTYGASEFRTLQLKTEDVHSRWFHWLAKWPDFWAACQEESRGSSGKNRIKPDRFLEILIPAPSRSVQERLVGLIDDVAVRLAEALRLRESIEKEREEMLRAFARELAKDAPRRPLQHVAPVTRRPVKTDKAAMYPELGIRSFGKGTFHKPAISGENLGRKRLFHIHPGDLVFSNVFSWEGAIAVAKDEDEGRVGSHRFITCVPDPALATAEFLRSWLLTDEGMSYILEASPGAAGRNRTLGLKKLMVIPVPLPPLAAQQRLSQLSGRIAAARQTQVTVAEELKAMLPAMLDLAFRGEL